MCNQSAIVVPHSVYVWTNRARVLSFLAACLFLATAPRVQAAGCHGQARPLMRFALSWEINQTTARSASELSSSPPVLSRLPCGSEVPFVSSNSPLPPFAALLASSALALPHDSGPSITHVCTEHSQPASLRLDRPPRSLGRL
jgi:hypothetical protein